MLRTAGAAGKQLRFPGEIPGNCGRIRLRRKLPPSHSERVANGQRRFRSSQRLTKTAKNSRFCRMSPRSEEEIPSVEIEAGPRIGPPARHARDVAGCIYVSLSGNHRV